MDARLAICSTPSGARRTARRLHRAFQKQGRISPWDDEHAFVDSGDTDPFSLDEPGLYACYQAAASGVAVSAERAGQSVLRLLVPSRSEPERSPDDERADQPVAEALGVNLYAKQLVDGPQRAPIAARHGPQRSVTRRSARTRRPHAIRLQQLVTTLGRSWGSVRVKARRRPCPPREGRGGVGSCGMCTAPNVDTCSLCGGPMRWLEATTEQTAIARLPAKYGLAPQPPAEPRPPVPLGQLALPFA